MTTQDLINNVESRIVELEMSVSENLSQINGYKAILRDLYKALKDGE